MTIIEAFYSILSAHAGLASLVSTKIYPVKAPDQTPYPYVVFTVEDDIPINRLNGRARADQVFTEIIIVTRTVADCLAIATEVRNALDRVAPGTYAGASLGRTQFVNQVGPHDGDLDDTFLIHCRYDTIINN